MGAAKNKFKPDIKRIILNPLIMNRDQLTSYAESEESLWHYGSETTFDISPPISGDSPPEFEPYIGINNTSQQFVCELSDVTLIGKYAIPQTNRGYYVLEEMSNEWTMRKLLSQSFDSDVRMLYETLRQYRSATNNTNTDYEVLINLVPRHFGGPDHQYHGNYGHWIAEDLPRLRGLHHYQQATGRTPDILIRENPPSWMTDTLQLLGFSSSDWVEWDRESATVSRLIVPKLHNYHSTGTGIDPEGRNWVSREMKKHIDMSRGIDDMPQRVFTSRQGHGSLKILNFDEVLDILNEFNFTSVRPEELSIENQVRLFHQADYVVGPFGANLANVIFCQEATIVEIFPHDDIRPVFFITANEQGLDYDYIVGEPENKETTHSSGNILVDTNKLKSVLSDVTTK